ncbi:hypothetical protein DITRI_Ditri04bG0052800 [Diplodiscus trichospermus]
MDGQKRNNISLGEVSFSSFRSTVHKLAEPAIQHPLPGIAPSGGIHAPVCLERNKSEEGEISVFGAEKYFNMKPDEDDEYLNNYKPSLKIENQIDLHQMTPRRWPGTSGASSEASWNSQTGLLRSFMRKRSENKQKIDGWSFFASLSCIGSCTDGKSVYVDQNIDHGRDHGKEYKNKHIEINHRPNNMDRRKLPRAKFQVKDEVGSQSFDQMSMGSKRQVYSGPSVLKPGLQNSTVNAQLDDPRPSLEVFGSNVMNNGDITKNLERKLSMLTWDAIPNAPTLSSISRTSQVGDEIQSDDSSDLFEIDNISGSGQALFTRQAYDGMSSCQTPYAPSETSAEWSVVTASAADRSNVSDYDERKSEENFRAPGSKIASKLANAKILPDKQAQRSRSGGILGCKSHKAVMVAKTIYRRDEKSKPSHLLQLPKSVTPCQQDSYKLTLG